MAPRNGHLQGPAVETPVLWHLEISHYNEKARWALDYKGIAHVRRAVPPALQELTARQVRAAFDMIETEAGPSGYLVGESFTVADLTAASILAPIVMPPEFPYIKLHPDERTAQSRRFRDSLKDRPGFKWVEEMYARHRGT